MRADEKATGDICSTIDRQQHEEVGSGQGKQTILPTHRCARAANNDIGVCFVL